MLCSKFLSLELIGSNENEVEKDPLPNSIAASIKGSEDSISKRVSKTPKI